ncbi:MAG: hypothetical protein LBF32_03665 [Streptococcaceae bacterium]|jgi:hypothetical protein|nr:hypothetical protein [Streptococcaceae bacterium]
MKKKGLKIISLFLVIVASIYLKMIHTHATRLLQPNGLAVTKPGQLVTFVGTNGFNGVNTPLFHRDDPTDIWIVMQIKGDHALIIKQNPIAVQKYKAQGFEARYDQSDIKTSVTTLYSNLPLDLKINGVDFHEYIFPVILHGEHQSRPYESNIIDQVNYQSSIDLDFGTIQAFVPSFIDVNQEINYCLDVDKDMWQDFISEFPSQGNLHSRFTWLRSPLYFFGNAANIGNNNIYSSSINNNNNFGVRPAFWIRV